MKLKMVNILFKIEMVILYKEQTKTIGRILFDIGTAHTPIISDIVEELGINRALLQEEINWRS